MFWKQISDYLVSFFSGGCRRATIIADGVPRVAFITAAPLLVPMAHNSGGSRRAITKGHIESFEIPLPPLAEQKAIAEILGTLDNQIELNRCMNRTLRAMSLAIFGSWFIDFEPVKEKATHATGFRGMPQSVFDKLPDQLTTTEFGPIPVSWQFDAIGPC